MIADINQAWDSPYTADLISVLVDINDNNTMQNFLRDIMTEKEIIELSSRLQAAKMLLSGAKYTDIVKSTNLSSRTVARISDWVANGAGGYQAVLKTNHHNHISPASAA